MPDFPLKLGELLEVEIEKLSFGGSGIARVHPEGAERPVVVFVPLSAPGDRLKIKISQIKKRHAEAEILEILKPGPDRVQAPCKVFGQCGGCNWQHLSYEAQIKNKQIIVEDFLKKFIDPLATKILPIVPSPKPLHYRNRAILKSSGHKVGFYKKNSHEIVPVDQCLILEEPLSQKILQIQEELAKKPTVSQETQNIELSLSSGDFSEINDELSESGFSQVNRFQNAKLIESVLTALNKKRDHSGKIFDLYAGSGNFTFPILEKYRQQKIIGVEMHSGASKSARDRLKKAGISPKNAEFYNADVGIFLRRFPLHAEDTVLLDPPRIGCSEEVISLIAAAKPRQILYISCDPAALARDLERLTQKSSVKYILQQVQCFDMFPQTHHVETLIELTN